MRCFKRQKARPRTAPEEARKSRASNEAEQGSKIKLWKLDEQRQDQESEAHTQKKIHKRQALVAVSQDPSRVRSLGPQGSSHTEDGTHHLPLEDRGGHGGDLSNSRIKSSRQGIFGGGCLIA